jgi:tetratricopeptide (TPR) repeat protein
MTKPTFQTQPPSPIGDGGFPSPTLAILAGVVVGCALLFWQARALWFTQDDAYISYRYAQNALAGHGLVFNIGERVEGYTNFLWVIWLALAGSMGFSFDAAAKLLGLSGAAGMIILAALLTQHLTAGLRIARGDWLAAGVALWLGANGALAYWAVSGLETAFFGFLVTLAIYLWWRGSRLTVIPITLAILTRPEGGLIWLLLAAGEWYVGRDRQRLGWMLLSVGLALIPFAGFKLLYYGDLLPNPFHAKTGLSSEYLASGLVYLWEFLRDYGLWGLALIPFAAALAQGERRLRVLASLWLVFALYVVAVGGDVLRPNRFFVPLLAVFAVITAIGLTLFIARWRAALATTVVAILLIAWGTTGWLLTRAPLVSTHKLEMALTGKLRETAARLRASSPQAFTVAASTIGRLGFELPGCRVIDMLGLTDREIARHPETIPGISSSWKERNFNAGYVLAQNPEYILFSTGYKPSAPAERALLLHSRFRRNYFGFLFYADDGGSLPVYRRKQIDTAPDSVWPDLGFADAVNAAFNTLATQDFDRIAESFSRAHHNGPGDYGLAVAYVGNALNEKGDLSRALAYCDSAIAIDSFTVDAWQIKAGILEKRGQPDSATAIYDDLNRILRTVR